MILIFNKIGFRMSIEGLTEEQFKILEPQMEKRVSRYHYGRKVSPWKPVVNSIFWVLRTGAPWKDLPRANNFAPPSTVHAWLGRMQAAGFLDQFLTELIGLAEQLGCIDVERLSVDGFFSSIRGGGEQVDYGYKGKGVTSHLLVSGRPLVITSTPASGDERQQVSPLLSKICPLISRVLKKGKTPILEAERQDQSLGQAGQS